MRLLVSLLTAITLQFTTQAQTPDWERRGNPDAGAIHSVAFSPHGAVFAACDSGLFASVDGGFSWSRLSGVGGNAARHLAIDSSGTIVVIVDALAGGNDGRWEMKRSTDGGRSWKKVKEGDDDKVTSLVSTGDDLYVSIYDTGETKSDGGIWRSVDHGGTWSRVSAGAVNESYVTIEAGSRTTLYMYDQTKGVLASNDRGKSWRPVYGASDASSVGGGSIAVRGNGDLLELNVANGASALYFVRADGKTRDLIAASIGLHGDTVTAVAFARGAIIVGTNRSAYMRRDGSDTWQPYGEGLGMSRVLSLIPDRTGYLYAFTDEGDLFRTFKPVR
jgi:photosystem II stability/assembly factor-like uncharacterized protein